MGGKFFKFSLFEQTESGNGFTYYGTKKGAVGAAKAELEWLQDGGLTEEAEAVLVGTVSHRVEVEDDPDPDSDSGQCFKLKLAK